MKKTPLRLWLLAGAGALGMWLAACAAPAPALVQGDAWEYALHAADLPAGWTFVDQSAFTAADLARPAAPLTATAALTEAVPASLAHAAQVYSAQFAPPSGAPYGDLTLQILLYPSAAEAQANLSAENPGAGWNKVEAPTVGDQSQVWRYQAWITDTTQGLYRVDFRYWNAIGSLVMLGTAEVLPGPDEPVKYARRVLDKFKAGADPAALRQLREASLPDVRGRLLNQAQLAGRDPAFADRWIIDRQYLGSWTQNADFGAQASSVLEKLGRVAGYQLYLVKPLTDAEASTVAGAALFQQVSAYRTAAAAPQGLQALVGLKGAAEIKDWPGVGSGSRAWSQVLTAVTGSQIAVTEISFYTGLYVGTIQLESPPLPAAADQKARLQANRDLALQFAQQLAANLAAAP